MKTVRIVSEAIDEAYDVGGTCDSPDDADVRYLEHIAECDPASPNGTVCQGDEPRRHNNRMTIMAGQIDNEHNRLEIQPLRGVQ